MLARHGISVVVKKSKAALGKGKKSIYANKPFYLPTINQFIFFKIEKNTQPTIKTHFKPVSSPESLKEVVARMCAKDGLAFSVFVTSQDLRKAMKALHPVEKLPNSSTGIKNLVVEYARKIRESYKAEIFQLKTAGTKFSIEFDEWTSLRNRRYLNIYLYSQCRKVWNLGLFRIQDSFTAEKVLQMVTDKLKLFNISLEEDVVATVTDGPSVMVKFGNICPAEHQLCFAHGIQLAVNDILYSKPKEQSEEDLGGTSDDGAISDDEEFYLRTDIETQDEHFEEADAYLRADLENLQDSEDEEDYLRENTQMLYKTMEEEYSWDLSHAQYKPIISKCRKIVKMFKRSPLKAEILTKYVKADLGRDLALCLDSKTRWNTMFAMLQRFFKLKDCIKKALIDLKCTVSIEEWEWDRIHDLVQVLEPIKLTVETLCRRDANLLTADTALNLTLSEILQANTPIGLELALALRKRIKERRAIFSSALQFLYTGSLGNDLDEVFEAPAKAKIISFLHDLILRLHPGTETNLETNEDKVVELEAGPSRPKKRKESEFQKKMKDALEKIPDRAHKSKTRTEVKTLKSTLNTEIKMFEGGGTKGLHLQLAYDHLLSVPPTSVESERVFSSSGYFCSKIRSSLEDNTLDCLSLLRSHFQKSSLQ